MAEYTLSNSAANIDSALTRVISADTSPTTASQNMVTSGGVKAALDSITGEDGSGSVTTSSFTQETLDTVIVNDATNSEIPTSKAVVDYVTDTYNTVTSAAILDTGIKYSGYTTPQWSSVRNLGTLAAGGYMINYQYQHCVAAYGNYASNPNAASIEIYAGSVPILVTSLPVTGNQSRTAFTQVSPSYNYTFRYIPVDSGITYRVSIQGNTVIYPSTQVRNLNLNFITVAPRK